MGGASGHNERKCGICQGKVGGGGVSTREPEGWGRWRPGLEEVEMNHGGAYGDRRIVFSKSGMPASRKALGLRARAEAQRRRPKAIAALPEKDATGSGLPWPEPGSPLDSCLVPESRLALKSCDAHSSPRVFWLGDATRRCREWIAFRRVRCTARPAAPIVPLQAPDDRVSA